MKKKHEEKQSRERGEKFAESKLTRTTCYSSDTIPSTFQNYFIPVMHQYICLYDVFDLWTHQMLARKLQRVKLSNKWNAQHRNRLIQNEVHQMKTPFESILLGLVNRRIYRCASYFLHADFLSFMGEKCSSRICFHFYRKKGAFKLNLWQNKIQFVTWDQSKTYQLMVQHTKTYRFYRVFYVNFLVFLYLCSLRLNGETLKTMLT